MRNKNIFIILFLLTLISGCEYEKKEYIPDYDWFELQRAYPFKEIPLDARLSSIEYIKNNFSVDYSPVSNWSLAGPVNIEGRITTVAIHPVNPQIVYIGCANGGVWKSTNFCQTWSSIFDNQNTSSIGSLVIDPVNPEVLYCGTGEANSLRSHYSGTGIFKSTNGGNNWTFKGLPNSYNIGRISINPLNTSEIFAAVLGAGRKKSPERGLYKSTDSGNSWHLSLFIADSVGAVDVVINSQNPNIVYTAMWERLRREDYIKYGGVKSGLYISTNSGSNWSLVSNGFPANDATLGRISLDISESNPNILYALLAYTSGNTRGLYKSTDSGNTWFVINGSAGNSSNYAWFNRICKVHPSNPDIVYAGGLYMNISSNGGTSFGGSVDYHVDQHAVAFSKSNPNYIVIGNDGGIDYSTNGGISFNESLTLPITQFYAGDINYHNPSDIMGGTQDNGTNRTTNGGLNNWVDIYGGDGFYCLYDYQNPQRMYAESQNGYVGRSTNGGASFISATSGLDLTYTNWSTPFVMDKINPLVMYIGTYKIFKTTNGMQSWTAISPDLANSHIVNLGTITTIDISSSNPSVIYAGTDDANVWVTTNGGNNWVKINSGLPDRWVTRVTVHPDSSNICYVSLSGYKIDTTGSHIYKTTNYGSSWINKRGNLPDAPVNDIIIDPRKTSNLYIATDLGVMVSYDDGCFWQILGGGLPSYIPVHDLTFHLPTLKLIAWTHGRSAFSITLPPITGIAKLNEIAYEYFLSQNYPNPFNSSTVFKFSLPYRGYADLSVFDINGRKISVLYNSFDAVGEYKINWDTRNLSSGIYFIKLSTGKFTKVVKALLIK